MQWMRSDPLLKTVSHIIMDEIHERDILSDFLITLLKDVLQKRPDLKVILMSATLNADLFSKYFNNCPTINIPGFTFPVQEFYLEDVLEMTQFKIDTSKKSKKNEPKWKKYASKNKSTEGQGDVFEDFIAPYLRQLRYDKKYSESTLESLASPKSEEVNHALIAKLTVHIHRTKESGAILVFVPGWDDIARVHKSLSEELSLAEAVIYPLHSLMPSVNQKEIFQKPPQGVRKVIVATNIAEYGKIIK
jgi:ATP-dependent RNA helicase DHX36